MAGESASIIGTGGASRAAAVGLIELGVDELAFFSRNIINASPMVNYLRREFPTYTVKVYSDTMNLCNILSNLGFKIL